MIVERPLPERVSCKRETAAVGIPNGESVIAQDEVQNAFAEPFDRQQQKSGVGKLGMRRRSGPDALDDLVTIVQPDIGGQQIPTITAFQRLAIIGVFGNERI
jgi:hypothetical protein